MKGKTTTLPVSCHLPVAVPVVTAGPGVSPVASFVQV